MQNTFVNGTIIGNPGISPGLLAELLPGNRYAQTNLVSDGSVPAATIDPNLINPWGVSFSPTSPYWVSDNGTGVTTFYNAAGAKQTIAGQTAITIAAPPGQTTPSAPTGQVFNFANTGFNISSGGTTAPSVFLFATEDGTISGWNPSVDPASSVIAVDNSKSGAVYKGLAIGQTQSGTFLYAADFSKGTVDMFNSNFQQVGSFTDPTVPAGFAPFNVQVLGGNLFVTFALQDATKHDDVAGPGNGFVDEFSLSGQLLQRVASGGPLNSPWGLAIAPPGFGPFAGDLLVGNFGDGTISIYYPTTPTIDTYIGKLEGPNGQPVQIPDLWALEPGNNSPGSNPSDIYFTAGLQNEAHGLFGTLSSIGPQPPAATTLSDPPPASAALTDSAKLTALLMGMNHHV
ncbi:MAG TPA: TIGR03118 family protein [Roseiarcus sp.]|jgi:uncharacterized protein (TIGR03118 family)